ncbi:MAG: nucleotidyltransferase family protein [bacterium]
MDTLLAGLERQRKKRYKKAQLVIEILRDILIRKYHIKKIILIGSCLNENNFHSHSDIDLCVEGLPHNCFFKALGELLIEAGEFNVDLIPIEDANTRMKEYIKKGKIIYEKS